MLAAVNPVALSECGQRHSDRSQIGDRGRYAPLAGSNHASRHSSYQFGARDKAAGPFAADRTCLAPKARISY
jgi:hypothetical protein